MVSLRSPERPRPRPASARFEERNIGDGEELLTQCLQQGLPVGAQGGILGVDHHVVEEAVYRFAQGSERGQRIAVGAVGELRGAGGAITLVVCTFISSPAHHKFRSSPQTQLPLPESLMETMAK